MLSGAILGGIFASPSVASILAAIRAVTLPKDEGGKGCLLIVKNYTGDRLNFGMACELANAEGRQVTMCVVADDCALPRTKGITGARGVAGTVFVHKASGGAAGRGMSLEEVTAIANTVAKSVGSMGVALNTVTVPGADVVNDRLSGADDKGEPMMEIGLGIHGEAGVKQCQLMPCDDIAKTMLESIQNYGREVNGKIVPLYNSGDQVIVLVNNLGGTSNFEMSLLARSLVTQIESAGSKATRVLVGSFMTSFDMQGASVSILPLNNDMTDEIVGLIDSSTDAPAWTKADVWKDSDAASRPSNVEIAEIATDTKDSALNISLPPVMIDKFDTLASTIISKCCASLIEAESELTKFDTIVGDGDCGITMARGAKEVAARLESNKLRLDHPSKLFSDLAEAVSASMGGTSGILLELMFRKASTTCASGGGITPEYLAESFKAGTEAISFYGGAREGSRTMLDALFPASTALLAGSGVNGAAIASRQGADATAKMQHAEAGRSNYVSDLKGTPDPGAVAVAVVFEAIASVFV